MYKILQMRAVYIPPEGQPVIDGAPVMLGPILNADAIKDWKTKDCTAGRILLSTIEEKLQNTLVGCKTAFKIWTRLSIVTTQQMCSQQQICNSTKIP
jgi:hypothetical protein